MESKRSILKYLTIILVVLVVLAFATGFGISGPDGDVAYADSVNVAEVTTYVGELKQRESFTSLGEAWSEAMAATTSSTSRAEVKLLADVTATSGSFAVSGVYNYAYLYVATNDYITLDLNGYTVDRGLTAATANGCVIYLNNGDLILTDTSIGGDGKVMGGFNSTFGGGVYVNGGSFTMNGGTISGNAANTHGGGIFVYTGSTLSLNGGAITGNTSGSAFLGGGVYFYGTALNLSGAADITGNVKGGTITGGVLSGGNANNIYLPTSQIIAISDNNSTTATDTFTGAIGVNMQTAGYITSGWTTTASTGTITSDDASYNVAIISNEMALVSPVASVTYNGVKTDYTSFAAAWLAAMDETTASGTRATVKLLSDFIATGSFVNADVNYNYNYVCTAVGDYITLDLNGHTLSRGLSSPNNGGYVLYVAGDLILTDTSANGDGIVTGGKNSSTGGGVYVNNGTFTMSGGTITGNNAGIYGGGVFVASGTFAMEGGEISNNKTDLYGGGVYLQNGLFYMSGGLISCNTSSVDGGGVYVNNGTFTMDGGEISDNTAASNGLGGGICYYGGNFNLEGSSIITGNVKGGTITGGALSGGTANNIYLASTKKITLNGAFTGSAGVTMATAGTITDGWSSYANSGTVTSDSSSYDVVISGGEKALGTAKASMTFNNITGNYATFADAWAAAMSAATSSALNAEVKLLADVVATSGSFAVSGVYSHDYIFVEGDDYITLDLNGYSVDRGLTEATADGYVIYIQTSGNLVLTDTSADSDGTLTGGYNVFENDGGAGGIYVNGALTMSGGIITGNVTGSTNYGTSGGGGVYVNNGTFTISGGVITENSVLYNIANGGGVYLDNSTATMTGGTISGNTAISGGGVSVKNNSVFTMNGGEISGNTASFGGGVYDSATFILTDGDITGNISTNNGGGVYVSYTTFTMSGGEISGNNATYNGSGIYCFNSTFAMESGIISGNNLVYGNGRSGSIYLNLSTFNLSGDAVIKDNVLGGSITEGVLTGGSASNVCLLSGNVITISATFTGEASVNMETAGTITSGWTTTLSTGIIKSDSSSYDVLTSGGEKALGTATASVTFNDITDSYGTFAEAWAAAMSAATSNENRATVKLLADVNAINGSFAVSGVYGYDYILVESGDYITLDLNGYKLDRNVTAMKLEGYVISVLSGGDFILTDTSAGSNGIVTGGKNNDFGGGVMSNGAFTMSGGSMSGNTGTYGGGVYVSGGSFTISGGTISGNTANIGGGVFNRVTFTMSGGAITGNTAIAGGGVYVYSDTFNLSGDAVITDNVINGTITDGVLSGGTANNVYLMGSKYITISAEFTGEAGVKMETAGIITSGWTSTSSTGIITSDDEAYCVETVNNEKTLVIPVASVTFNGVNTNYSTFAAAWTAATNASTSLENRATVKLLSDLTGNASGSFVLTVSGLTFGHILIVNGDYITLDLNGYTVNRNLPDAISAGYVISVAGNFILTDTSDNADGVVTGGKNSGGTYGGGVYVSGGTFIMNGGTITGNTASRGSGVYLYNSSTFTFNGGTICENTASEYGGGVYIDNSTFTMNGGSIRNNTSIGTNGGVYLVSTTFDMKGGSITGNTAASYGGVYVYGGTFKLSGDAVILSNVIGGVIVDGVLTGGTASNIYLPAGKAITVSEAFTGSASVTMQTAGIITSGWTSSGSSGTVISDNIMYVVYSDGDEKKLTAAKVSVTYGETIETYIGFTEAWAAAMSKATSSQTRATVKLFADVTAESGIFAVSGVYLYDFLLVESGDYITLDLNGYTLNRNLSTAISNGEVIIIYGNFILTDTSSNGAGKMTGGYNNANGGGVYCASSGVFTMNGGEISGNTAGNGGGVYCEGSFVMNGGTVCSNIASLGSGVYIYNAVFTLNGGTIRNNISTYFGGGVYIENSTFTMDGGIIKNNITQSNCGGGVYIKNGTFTLNDGTVSGNNSGYGGGVYNEGSFVMNGGTVYGNTAGTNGGGLYNASSATFNLSGASDITDNVKGGTLTDGVYLGGTANNIYLASGALITLSGVFTGLAGVTMQVAGTITDDWTLTSSTGIIMSDDTAYSTVMSGGEKMLGTIKASLIFDVIVEDYATFAEAWAAAMSAATSSETTATVKLFADIIATNGSFAVSGVYSYEYILIDSGDYITLDLNGYTVNRNLTEVTANGYVIKVASGGNFELTDTSIYSDGVVEGGYNTNGGGVYVSGGTFALYGGIINGNTATNWGGGVYMSDGTFTMNGGYISGNTATVWGGGVYYANASFTMNGGTICDNTAVNYGGGGVYMTSVDAIFTMNNGIISENSSTKWSGGGVYISNGTFDMSGGAISGNNAETSGGGVYVYGNINISGNASITDNFVSGNTNNVYLTSGKKIAVNAAFTGSAGVTMQTAGIITDGWSSSVSTGTFTSDDASYTVKIDNNECTLMIYYRVSYLGNGNTEGSVPADSTIYFGGDTVTVLGNSIGFSRTGYTFGGWSYISSIYSEGNTIEITYSIEFNAVWNLNSPVISAISEDYSGIYDGQNHNISVTATHEISETYSLTYQWYKDSVSEENSIYGATERDYAIKYVADTMIYYCVVSITDNNQTMTATSGAVTVAVTAKPLTVVWSGENGSENDFSWVYTGSVIVPSAVVDTGIDNETLTITISGGAVNANVSAYTATSTGNDNYTLSNAAKDFYITKADYDMTGISFANGAFEYDGLMHTLVIAGTLPTGADGKQITVSYSGSATNVSDGAAIMTATFATTSNNYNVPSAITAMVTITAKTITVTADAKAIKEGAVSAELTYTSDELCGEDVFTGSLAKEGGNTAGRYAIIQGTLTAGDNYLINYVGATYTISAVMIETDNTGSEAIDAVVSIPDGIDPDAELIVKIITESTNASFVAPEGMEILHTYNAQMFVNGEAVSTDGEITISLAVPQELAASTECMILIVENGVEVQKTAVIANGYVTFTTTSLGDFLIVTDRVESSGLSAGAIVGITIGSIIALTILLLIILFLLWLKKGVAMPAFLDNAFEKTAYSLKLKSNKKRNGDAE